MYVYARTGCGAPGGESVVPQTYERQTGDLAITRENRPKFECFAPKAKNDHGLEIRLQIRANGFVIDGCAERSPPRKISAWNNRDQVLHLLEATGLH